MQKKVFRQGAVHRYSRLNRVVECSDFGNKRRRDVNMVQNTVKIFPADIVEGLSLVEGDDISRLFGFMSVGDGIPYQDGIVMDLTALNRTNLVFTD